jgi:hypothetical protein
MPQMIPHEALEIDMVVIDDVMQAAESKQPRNPVPFGYRFQMIGREYVLYIVQCTSGKPKGPVEICLCESMSCEPVEMQSAPMRNACT